MNPRKPRILIVDDVPTNVEILGAALEAEYEIHFATSGEEALEVAAHTPPQMILLDIMMPGMDGYETCRRLRANPALTDVPVIFVTALEQAESEIEGLSLGAEDYIVKPFNVELTRLRVRNLLERRRTQARLALALHSANEGLWEWDLTNGMVEFDPQWAEPLGYAPGEMQPHIVEWMSIVHRDDLPEIFAIATNPDRDISVEVRLRNRNDGWTWVQLIGRISERGDNGQPARISGAYLDISRRKQAEEALIERERRLEVLIASLQDSLFVLDTAGTIVSQHLAGETSEALAARATLGKPYGEVFAADLVSKLDDAIAAILIDMRPIHFECALAGNGREVQLKVSVSALADSRRLPTGFMILARDISDIKAVQEEIRQLAFVDPLTQLPNRRLLMERVHKALLDCRRHGDLGALLFIDLDNFKFVNDQYGHDHGDDLLIQVAHRLQGSVRANDTVARLGGDEFVVLLENLGQTPDAASAHARKLAEAMLASLNQPFDLGSIRHSMTPSIGATVFSSAQQQGERLIQLADQAMYQAKTAGKNQIRFSSSN